VDVNFYKGLETILGEIKEKIKEIDFKKIYKEIGLNNVDFKYYEYGS
jgi:hypothetical protein